MQDDTLGTTISSESKAYELLEELELGSRVDVREAREKLKISIDAAIEVRPADIARRGTLLIEGSARKLGRQGVSTICSQPVEVGSVFHLELVCPALDLEPVLAICDRCVLLDTNAFGVHFQFVEPVEISHLDHDTSESRTT